MSSGIRTAPWADPPGQPSFPLLKTASAAGASETARPDHPARSRRPVARAGPAPVRRQGPSPATPIIGVAEQVAGVQPVEEPAEAVVAQVIGPAQFTHQRPPGALVQQVSRADLDRFAHPLAEHLRELCLPLARVADGLQAGPGISVLQSTTCRQPWHGGTTARERSVPHRLAPGRGRRGRGDGQSAGRRGGMTWSVSRVRSGSAAGDRDSPRPWRRVTRYPSGVGSEQASIRSCARSTSHTSLTPARA